MADVTKLRPTLCPEVTQDVCCEAFGRAQLHGTSGDTCQTCLYFYNDQWRVGSHLPAIRFCPWCGAVK